MRCPSAGALHDDPAQCDEPDGSGEFVSPLSRGNPCAGQKRKCCDHAEVGGVVQVLAVEPDHELRRHRETRSQRVRPERIRTQQDRQAEARDERGEKALLLQALRMEPARLRCQAGGERQRHLRGPQREVAGEDAESQQRCQEQDLENPRILRQARPQPGTRARHRKRRCQGDSGARGCRNPNEAAVSVHGVCAGHSASHQRFCCGASNIRARIALTSPPVSVASVCASRSSRAFTASK